MSVVVVRPASWGEGNCWAFLYKLGSTDFWKGLQFWKGWFKCSILLLIDSKTGLKWTCRRQRITQVAIFVLLSCSSRTKSVPMRTWACINVFRTSDGKHYIRRSFLNECCSISHCPTKWWAFLLERHGVFMWSHSSSLGGYRCLSFSIDTIASLHKSGCDTEVLRWVFQSS